MLLFTILNVTPCVSVVSDIVSGIALRTRSTCVVYKKLMRGSFCFSEHCRPLQGRGLA
jgi:hypothetical protein